MPDSLPRRKNPPAQAKEAARSGAVEGRLEVLAGDGLGNKLIRSCPVPVGGRVRRGNSHVGVENQGQRGHLVCIRLGLFLPLGRDDRRDVVKSQTDSRLLMALWPER